VEIAFCLQGGNKCSSFQRLNNMQCKNSFTGESDSGETVLECPECGAEMRLIDSRNGMFYSCVNFPDCKTTHGCHKDGSPLGIPGNKETRLARIEAHRWFDALWKTKKLTRGKSYRMLQDFMHMDRDACHIGRFTKVECEKATIFAKGVCKMYGVSPDEE